MLLRSWGGSTEQFQQLHAEYENKLQEIDELDINVRGDFKSNKVDAPSTKDLRSNPQSRKETAYCEVTTFKIKFDSESSNEERLDAIFSNLNNKFGFSARSKQGESKDLLAGNKKIGTISFIASMIKKIEYFLTDTNKPTEQVADDNLLRGPKF